MTSLDTTEVRGYLKEASFKPLFIEELGWNLHRGASLSVTAGDHVYQLAPIAEKRGVQVFECSPAEGGAIPDRSTRQKIEREVTKSAREHLIVFTTAHRTEQLWQWVARQPGRPAAFRDQRYARHQSGDALIQKLQSIAIPLDEEEAMSLTGVTQKLKDAFDKDKVTKKFYERFKTEHGHFLKLVNGIDDTGDREWYASLMLNRLMFIYFIQKKGFLDGDPHYLRNRLARMQQKWRDKFHTFYRHFLLRLFHEGLGHQPPRSSELDELLGDVPYLNGGLFDVHELESENPNIEIPDRAFEALFDFFDAYEWHLDDRPLRTGREINPDVLGYIFEKYVNQKQMGAYYTKEDITQYIAKNTVIPYLFDAAEKECAIAFQTNSAVWRLLSDDPDRYIYAAVRKGVDEPLPNEVAAGIHDVSKRNGWNRPADAEFALPTETWREHVARRRRCLDVRAKMEAGEVTSINDLVTYNLDIRQFAQDVIEQSEGPELVRAFFNAIKNITVLDPAVGSGAFLFAALNILKPLYEACLDRMQAFIDDLREAGKDDPGRYADFRDMLARVAEHPNREYYVLKSIIINNLYGVDIMEEAVEICKLRLFLKLVAQLDRSEEIEPLPDMDFNIRAGNTLVGFTSLDAVREAMTLMPNGQHRMLSTEDEAALAQIEKNAAFADEAFQEFHRMQAGEGIDEESFAAGKAKVREWLDYLRGSLDHHLAREYGIDPHKHDAFERWRAGHQPFHWFVEFYGIMKRGGFDVVIGNPPYVEYKDVKAYRVLGFHTLGCGDLYAFMLERAYQALCLGGRVGVIVPISMFGTDGFLPLQELSRRVADSVWVSFFANRPAQLFEGAQKRLTIYLARRGNSEDGPLMYTTRYFRWKREERAALLQGRLEFQARSFSRAVFPASLEKLGSPVEVSAFGKLLRGKGTIGECVTDLGEQRVYYTRKFGYFLAFLDFIPSMREVDTGAVRLPSELKDLAFQTSSEARAAISALSSSTFFWFWNTLSDCRNVNRRDLLAFPLSVRRLVGAHLDLMASLGSQYLSVLRSTSRSMLKSGLEIETFDYGAAKPMLDEIDKVMFDHFGFDPDEADFVLNYDIKYRMGADEGGAEEGGDSSS